MSIVKCVIAELRIAGAALTMGIAGR